MFYYRGQRVGDTVRFSRPGFSVGVSVVSIGGDRRDREAELEIKCERDSYRIHLSSEDKYFRIVGGIRVRIRDEDRSASNKVNLNYSSNRPHIITIE